MRREYRTLDKNLELRDNADGAETSSASEAAIKFAVRKIGMYKAVVILSAVDVADTDETYVFNIEVSDASGGTYTSIASLSFAAGAAQTGSYDIPLSGQLAEQLDADAEYIRVTATLGGTTPSVTYGCYLTKA